MTEREIKEYENAVCGSFHFPKTHKVEAYASLGSAGTITGCGLAQIRGVGSITEANLEKFRKTLDKAKKELKTEGAGAIFCTLGADFFQVEKHVLKLGFELVKEYPNYRHGVDGSYKQRMYILTL